MFYKLVDEKSVFANNELSLRDISVYGFDYDYTLAHYTDELNSLIYQMSLEKLMKEYSVSLSTFNKQGDKPKKVPRHGHCLLRNGNCLAQDTFL